MSRRRNAAIALAGVAIMAGFVAAAAAAVPHLEKRPELVKDIRARLNGARFVTDKNVVLQQKAYDCGAAALKTVLASRGIERDLGALEAELLTTAAGTSLLNLRLTATRAGLPAKSWFLTDAALAEAPLPVIAFVDGDHFVVVERFITPKTLEVVDPAIGRVHWPLRSFRKFWAGHTLVFDPHWSPDNKES